MFIGESYTFFLENFQDSYTQVGYYLPTGESEKEMNVHIREEAENFGTHVFAMDRFNNGAFNRTITIYGDEYIKEKLKEDWNIEEGIKKSFFSGTTKFYFEPFEKAKEKNLKNCWYTDKSNEELYDMVYPNMVKYSGSFRNYPSKYDSKITIVFAWFIVGISMLVLTLYDITYGKKEQNIRIILGADNRRLQFKKIILDIIGITISGVLSFILINIFTNPLFEIKVSLIFIIGILILNSILIFFGMRIKKNATLKLESSNKVLAIGTVLKGVVQVLMVVIISITIGLIVEGIKLYSQRDFYDSKKDLVHVDIEYPYDYEKIEYIQGENDELLYDTNSQVSDNFLRYSYKKLSCSLIYHHSYSDVSPKFGHKYVYANLKGIEEYRDEIYEFEELENNEGNYILISEDVDEGEVLNELLSFSNITHLSKQNLDGVFRYKKGLSIVTEGRRESEYDYSYKIKNPVIILDTFNYGKLLNYEVKYSPYKREKCRGVIYNDAPYLMQFVSVKNDRKLIENFGKEVEGEVIKSELLEYSVENIKDWYNGLWSLQNRSLLVALILTILFIILEFQISVLVLSILYETKAKELVLKKVLGYSTFERYRRFFILSLTLSGLSLGISIGIYFYMNLGIISNMIYGSIIVLVLDFLILTYLTKKYDRLEVQRVLKGGI